MRAAAGFILILALVIFLLSNRNSVNLNYWPFGFVLTLPLGAVVLVVLVLGFMAGLLAHLPGRMSAKRRAKRAEKRVAELESRTALVVQPGP